MRRSAGAVGLAVFGSRLLGLVREVVLATLFGAGRELDAFIAAFRIPNLLRDLFAEGALSAAFVSTFSRKLEREGTEAAWALASRVLNDLLIVVGTLVTLGIVFSPVVVDWVAPGFHAEPGKFELTTTLARVLFPFLLFVALAAVAMGILNSRGHFLIPASASMAFNLGAIVAGIGCAALLAPEYVRAVVGRIAGEPGSIPAGQAPAALLGMAIGTLCGGALQFLVQLPSLRRAGFRFRWIAGFRDPGVREVLRLMGPATIGIAAVQVNVVVNTYFASGLGNGPVSWLNAAFRVMYLPIGMFGVGLGMVVLPAVSRDASRGDMAEFRRKIADSLHLLLLLCVPAAVGLALLAEPILAAIYEHGRFLPSDSRAAAAALSAYSVGLCGYAAIKVLGPAFYAMNDAATPMRVSLCSVALNFALNWAAIRVLGLGHGGLALSTSLVALTNSVLLFVFLRRKIGALPGGLLAETVRIGAAALVMGAACWLWAGWIGSGDRSFWRELRVVATTVPLGVVVFAAAGRALGISELRRLRWGAIPLPSGEPPRP